MLDKAFDFYSWVCLFAYIPFKIRFLSTYNLE